MSIEERDSLEAMSRLARGVAHDFNNLLLVILGTAEILKHQLGSDHPASTELGEITRAAESARELTCRLLSSCGPAARQTVATQDEGGPK